MMRSTAAAAAAAAPLSRRHRAYTFVDAAVSVRSEAHHDLHLLSATAYASAQFLCHLCWERGSGAHYHCSDCQLDFHASCVAARSSPVSAETHFSHAAHPLLPIQRSIATSAALLTCDGCGDALTSSSAASATQIHSLNSNTTAKRHEDEDEETFYRCSRCDFDLCAICIRAPRFILHPSHKHVLVLGRPRSGAAAERGGRRDLEEEISGGGGACTTCDGCGEMVDARAAAGGLAAAEEEEEEEEEEVGGCMMMYRCLPCNFDVHEACIRLPLKPLLSHVHPDHPLTLLFATSAIPSNQLCHACGQHIFSHNATTTSSAAGHYSTSSTTTWLYTCSLCSLFVHPTCARVHHHFLPSSASTSILRRHSRPLVNRAAASSSAIATWPRSLLMDGCPNDQLACPIVMNRSASVHNYNLPATPRRGGGGGGGASRRRQ